MSKSISPLLQYKPLPEGVTKVKDFPKPTTEEAEARIGLFRKIVQEKQYQKIRWIDREGIPRFIEVDLFSAGTVVAVYEALSEPHRLTFTAVEPPAMIDIAFKASKAARTT
jgi:hypothetical protein